MTLSESRRLVTPRDGGFLNRRIFAPAVTAGEKKARLAAEFRVLRQTLYAVLA
jgi:hypothetical protein